VAVKARLANAVVLLAGAVVGIAAVVDAFRDDGGHERRVTGTATTAEALRAAGAQGTLYFTDDRCRVRALRLPSLVAAPAPRAVACSVAVADQPLRSASWSLWKPGSRLVAFCARDRVLVHAERGPPLPFIVGCAPVWAPTGALDLVRHGSLVQFAPHGRAEIILRREDVGAVRGAAWVGPRLAVATRRTLFLLDGNAPVAARAMPKPASRLRASPGGSWLAVRSGLSIDVFDLALRLRRRLPGARALAWSPDERWRAIAYARTVRLVRRDNTAVTLPLVARDLAWR
jgi:hypothetical protein